jgi:hypothetical protein
VDLGARIGTLKTVSVLTFLLVGSCALVAQNSAPVTPADNSPNAPSRLYEENGKRPGAEEYMQWLNQNKRLFKRCDICELNFSWFNEVTKFSIAVNNAASFFVGPEDEHVSWLIPNPDSGLDVRVGVQYVQIRKGIWQIRTALAFEGDVDDIFSETSRSEAQTARDKDWKYVMVRKDTAIKYIHYTFSLSCGKIEHSVAGVLLRAQQKSSREKRK